MRYLAIAFLTLMLLALSAVESRGQCDYNQIPNCWLAQGGPPRGQGPHGHGGTGGFDPPDRRHLEQLRMLKMLELLDLNEDQEMPFVTMFHRARQDMRELQRENRELVGRLAEGLAADTLADAAIEDLIDRIHELKLQQIERARELVEDSKEILTAMQRGKLVVFHERFEAEMLKKLRAFRERRFERGSTPDNASPHTTEKNEPQ